MSEISIFNKDSYLFYDEFSKMILNKNSEILERGIDHIITDPPYNISKDSNFNTMKNRRTGVDFGYWDRGEFDLYSWIPKYSNLLTKNGSMIIFCSYRFLSYIINILENSNMIVKDIIIWQKSNPMPRNTNRRYVQDMEFAVWSVKKEVNGFLISQMGKVIYDLCLSRQQYQVKKELYILHKKA